MPQTNVPEHRVSWRPLPPARGRVTPTMAGARLASAEPRLCAVTASFAWATCSKMPDVCLYSSLFTVVVVYCAVQPPSTLHATPRTWLAAGEQRKTASAPMSSGVTKASEGCFPRITATAASSREIPSSSARR